MEPAKTKAFGEIGEMLTDKAGHTALFPTNANGHQETDLHSATKNGWNSLCDVILFISPILAGDSHYALHPGFIKFGWNKEIQKAVGI